VVQYLRRGLERADRRQATTDAAEVDGGDAETRDGAGGDRATPWE